MAKFVGWTAFEAVGDDLSISGIIEVMKAAKAWFSNGKLKPVREIYFGKIPVFQEIIKELKTSQSRIKINVSKNIWTRNCDEEAFLL